MLSQLLRYAPVISLIQRTRPDRILEIGPGSQGLGKFLSCRFIGVDRDFSDYTGIQGRPNPWMLPVRASGTQLPLASRSFDLVLLLDVLEHLSPESRPRILEECDRVARVWIAVGFPCGAPAWDHDRKFHRWLLRRALPVPGWLREHLAHPFPTVEEVAQATAASATRLRVADNAWLPAHRFLVRWEATKRYAHFSAALSDLLAPTAWDWKRHRTLTNVLRMALRRAWPLVRALERKPGYRKLIVVEKDRGGGKTGGDL
jgi:SAM-dependent methyltransferase